MGIEIEGKLLVANDSRLSPDKWYVSPDKMGWLMVAKAYSWLYLISMNDCNVSKRNSERGFTLIELMVTLVVAAILLAIAIPSFRGLIERSQVTTAVNDLMGDVMTARSEAIKRGDNVTLCRSNDESTCSGSWSDGWILFSDSNGNATVDADEIIRVKGSWGNGLVVSEAANQTQLTYTSMGMSVSAVSLRIMRGATIERCIDVDAVGRATIVPGEDCP